MNLSAQFKAYLLSQKQPASKATVKNYLSDLNRFISWYEAKFGRVFNPEEISSETIESFRIEGLNTRSASSVERNLSSLRKFFTHIKQEGTISHIPFEAKSTEYNFDHWKIKEFKNNLFVLNSSPLTIKNYIIDLNQFKSWLEETLPLSDLNKAEISNLIYNIDSRLISDYKYRLLENLRLSPASVNRKLSSLRSYTNWARSKGLIKSEGEINISNEPNMATPLILPVTSLPDKDSGTKKPMNDYSKFPPVRLLQKSRNSMILLFDLILIAPLSALLLHTDKIIWIIKGKPVFEELPAENIVSSALSPLQSPKGPIRNIPKSYYAPTHISVANFPRHKKALHYIRYSRPKWYIKYHSYTFTSYLHFSILMLVVMIFGFIFLFNHQKAPVNPDVLASVAPSPNKTLSFQGKITDEFGLAIDKETNLRMGIYSSYEATGSALLWQDVVFTAPDANGIFNVILGQNTPLPQNVFYENSALWLGISVESTQELAPRQPIATVAYASNTDTIQGLLPITSSDTNKNVLLALNSSGNLTIGGTSSPVFRVTGGTFTLTGKTLVLATNIGSNGNIILNPDGSGIIDIQKVIKNTSNNNKVFPGAVQVQDSLIVNSGTTNEALLGINQTSTGDLIIASSSGITKFLVDGAGNITAGDSYNGLSVLDGTITKGTWNGFIIDEAYGGTGINTSSSTGVPFISSGTWSIDPNSLSPRHGGTGITSYAIGDLLYSDSENNLVRLGIGASGYCLISNGSVPSWSPCLQTTSDSIMKTGLGAIYPNNSTLDFFIGGSSTISAKFALLNSNAARGNQTASISGGLTLDSSSASIQTTNSQTLSLGGSKTGNIQINNITGATYTTFDTFNSTVGIGITLPEAGLHITRPANLPSTGKALVILNQTENQDILTASASGVTVFRVLNDGTVELNLATAGITNDAVCWDNSGLSQLYDCDSTPADYAESYPVESNVEYADIVMTTNTSVRTKIGTNVPRLTKATNNQNSKILGVTSDNWHDFTSAGKDEIDPKDNPLPVALNGRVKTKVNSQNGEINIGDPITASSLPGVGMKSTKPEMIVGTALENYSSDNPQDIGEILVFINPTYYDPIIIFANNKNGLQIQKTEENDYEIINNNSILERSGAYSDLFVARLKAGYLELGRLTVNTAQITFASITELSTDSLAVASENITIAGVNLKDYVYSIVDARLEQKQIAISSPILETDIIRPENGNEIAIKLPTNDSNSRLEIRNASDSAVAVIDAEGNASFSGQLSSNGLDINEASVSGTLRAGRLVADALELSGNALSSLQNSISTSSAIVNNYYYNQPQEPEDYYYSSDATGSATLASITADYGVFMNGFTSFGDTSFYDATIANRLFVGAHLSIADKSINVLGGNLQIQSLRQGGVDFMDGKIVINTDGNLEVNGNAKFAKNVDIKGKLAAGIISPLPGKGLVFQFNDIENEDSGIEFRTGTESAVLSFNNQGDISSSGSGTFNKLNLNIIPDAIAVSDTEIIATGSAGTTEIKSYKNELTIKNPLVTKDSLIYITAKTSLSNQSVYLLRQVAGESFTVGISKVVEKTVPFNWIIIN